MGRRGSRGVSDRRQSGHRISVNSEVFGSWNGCSSVDQRPTRFFEIMVGTSSGGSTCQKEATKWSASFTVPCVPSWGRLTPAVAVRERSLSGRPFPRTWRPGAQEVSPTKSPPWTTGLGASRPPEKTVTFVPGKYTLR